MAINIFSGGAAKTAKTPRVSSAAERAQATTSAISGPAVASDSGSTAVKSTGTLGKIGSFIGKAAGFLGNILPGPAGAIAKAVGNITSANDPEWWQHVPGDGLSVNSPLQPMKEGDIVPAQYTTTAVPLLNMRPTFLEFVSSEPTAPWGVARVMSVTDRMSTQYLMPAVRKVINAVLLQSSSVYARVFEAQVTMYALWRNLKKYEHFVKHGYTFVANLNDSAFPVYQVGNAAWLQSTITRLEEYLHSHVRLPHTVCEYVSWRYGRMFRSNNSAKAAFVEYNVLAKTRAITDYETLMASIQNYLSSTDAITKAVSDLYNAYQDHDQEVLMPEESMIMYDSKEFCLRTNLDIMNAVVPNPWTEVDQNPIIIDSNLDNPTVFMASTVSSLHDNTLTILPLFPVYDCNAYLARSETTQQFFQFVLPTDNTGTSAQAANGWALIPSSSTWMGLPIYPRVIAGKEFFTDFTQVGQLFFTLTQIEACKALDFYNVGIFFAYKINSSSGGGSIAFADETSISMDMGAVPDLVIANENVLAFANLVSEENKHAETYKTIEKRAAKDIANFVENNEVAAISK